MIPQKIHLTCKNKDALGVYGIYVMRMKKLHPQWEISIYDDGMARQIINDHFPDLLSLYDNYTAHIQRTDLFRIAVVYLFGGFYMDMDIKCLKSLDNLCDHDLLLGEEKTLSAWECKLLGLDMPLRIANYMFGSVAKHPFWAVVVKEMINRSAMLINSENDILESTGPGLLTYVYHTHKDTYNNITVLLNADKKCENRCSNQPSCHFGNYAAHLHLGSWRWEYKEKQESKMRSENGQI